MNNIIKKEDLLAYIQSKIYVIRVHNVPGTLCTKDSIQKDLETIKNNDTERML